MAARGKVGAAVLLAGAFVVLMWREQRAVKACPA